jgi:hypothetical protein
MYMNGLTLSLDRVTHNARSYAERVLLEILGALLFTLQEIDSDEFERNVLLFEYHRDGAGGSGDIHSIKFQDHCDGFPGRIVGGIACGEGTWRFGLYTARSIITYDKPKLA